MAPVIGWCLSHLSAVVGVQLPPGSRGQGVQWGHESSRSPLPSHSSAGPRPHTPPCPISLSLLALVVGAAPGAAPGVALSQGLVREQGSHGALHLVRFATEGVLSGAVVGALPVETDVTRWPWGQSKS